MIRRPPRSSPFPCPAVFRSGDGADALALDEGATVGRAQKVDEVGLIGLDGRVAVDGHRNGLGEIAGGKAQRAARLARKSTRLNSSPLVISYADFCLKHHKPS